MRIGFWWENQKKKRTIGRTRRRLEDNIKILEKYDGMVWTGLMWLRIGTSAAGSCEHGDEPSGSIKCWESLE
jgi:hypothetical protein